jgi:hypothetical protein
MAPTPRPGPQPLRTPRPAPTRIWQFPLVDRLDGWARRTETQGDCRCPAHPDSQASLSVGLGREGLLLRCHAGCETTAILAALGAGWRDLFTERPQGPGGSGGPGGGTVGAPGGVGGAGARPALPDLELASGETLTAPTPAPRLQAATPALARAVAAPPQAATPTPTPATAPPPRAPATPTPEGAAAGGRLVLVERYDYLDAAGGLVFQVSRFQPKTFRQRHMDTQAGRWVNRGVAEARRVLYRLPRLLDPTLADRVVFLAEGEKDVHTLERCGLLATTAPGGAAAGQSKSKWLPQYTQTLAGRRVVIVPDSDPAGRQHAETVAGALNGRVAHVAILELPLPPGLPDPFAKWDVTDWLRAGGTREAFGAALQIALSRPWQPSTRPAAQTARTNATADTNARVIGQPNQPGQPGGPANTNADPTDSTQPPPPPLRICNFEPHPETSQLAAVSISEICRRVRERCEGWPKRASNVLFVHDRAPSLPPASIHWLTRSPELWGWVGAATGEPPLWLREPGGHSREEVFARLLQTVERYDAVETAPHEPPMRGHYYAHDPLPEPQGTHLTTLLNFFNPASAIDREILLALFATLAWGGPGGARPIFVITSPDGRGAGKTSLAVVCAAIFAGKIDCNPQEDFNRTISRLLSPEGLTRRIAVLDNIKSHRFSWGELEAAITTDRISGHRLHVGEGSRPNTLTWILTLNGVSLSTDLAKRSIVLKLLRPQAYQANWMQSILEFIENHRAAIWADLIAFLRGPQTELTRASRWGWWESQVLSRCHEPDAIFSEILDRQEGSDAEAEETEDIEEFFRARLGELHYDTDRACVFIPSAVAAEWVRKAVNDRHLKNAAAVRMLRQRITEGAAQNLVEDKGRKLGRGFIWSGTFGQDPHVFRDLEERQNQQHRPSFF